jgi:tripeptidyl-peptidase-1
MLAVQFALFAAIATLSNAVPTSLKHALHENRLTPSLDWVKGARIERGSIIPMRIGLTQTNLEKGHDYLSMCFLVFYLTILLVKHVFS